MLEWRKLIIIVFPLALMGCLNIEAEHVAVVGVGEARMFPTHAALSVTLEGEGDTAAAATEALNIHVNRVRAIATEFGVASGDISSGYFDVDRQTISVRRPDGSRYSEDGPFLATQQIRVTIENVAEAGQLLGLLIEADAEEVSPPLFLIDDTKQLFEKARELAIKDAVRRAELYAQKAGKVLGPVQIIEEAGTDSQRLRFNLRDRFVEYYKQEETGGELELRSPGYAPEMDAISVTGSRVFAKPEEIAVNVSIYVKFTLQ